MASDFCSGLSRKMLFVLGVLSLLQVTSGVMEEDGVMEDGGGGVMEEENSEDMSCTSAEELFMHTTKMIDGGCNTIHPEKKKACEDYKKEETAFRTPDGTCNAKYNLGAAFSPVKRLMSAHYGDGMSTPRNTTDRGTPMHSARTISLKVHRPKDDHSYRTLMVMQIGQFADHDCTVVPVPTETDDSIRCCNVSIEKKHPECLEIYVRPNDHVFHGCMEFVRSVPYAYPNGTTPKYRSHFNAITAFLDASNIYGSGKKKAHELRANNGTGGLMKTSYYKGKETLPEGHSNECINLKADHFCSNAGDSRANEQPGLTAIHLLFVLEHNRLTRKLVKVILYRSGRPYNADAIKEYLDTAPTKIQERLYQVIRKVLGAVWQNVVYGEWLPEVLGPYFMSKYRLWTGRRIRYDPSVDPSISHEFSTCAFRFGHTLVNNQMLTDKMRDMKELFGVSEHSLEHFNKIVKGLVSTMNHAQHFSPHMAKSLVDHLFENQNQSLDLAALNIQRSRDHAIPTFNKLRKFFGLKPFQRWKQFGDVYEEMKSVYDEIDDVECFPGGTAEKPVKGGIVGPTFANIIGQQFHDLKYGDKYYFETDNTFYGFTSKQLKSLKRLCFSKIICENAALKTIQTNPFRYPDYWRNPEYRCRHYPDINMWHWSQYFM